ncbi:MAG: redoxin domain-containing protein [Proteiniphilum sp.]|jgi:peroxiredoxin|nr:redoxin domain-containing protein [Proteiniphilum sp.]
MSIRGEIANLDAPYILATYLSADTLAVDTIRVNEKGKFRYEKRVDTLTVFSLYLNDCESAAVVFADKGESVKMKGDAMLPDLIEVSGNEINSDLTTFKAENRELLTQRGRLLLSLNAESPADTAGAGSMTLRNETAKLHLLNYALTSQAEDFVRMNPTRYSSLILISNFFKNSDNPPALERVLGYLKGDITRTPLAARLKSYSEKISRSAEGAPMPVFMLEDTDGDRIRSSDFNGKYLLLSFISTAGVESRETVSLLKEAYPELNRDSVEFLTICIDSDHYPLQYDQSDSIPWTVVPEKRSWGADIVDAYNVQYIPFNILIAPDGNIKVRNIPAQEVVNAIENTPED